MMPFDPSTLKDEPDRVGVCQYVEEVEDSAFGKHYRCYFKGWFFDINKPCFACREFVRRKGA